MDNGLAEHGQRVLGVEAEDRFGVPAFEVPAAGWVEALTLVRDELGCRFFDWLSAVDELADGFTVIAHLARIGTPGSVPHLLVRTELDRAKPVLATATTVYPGAGWHERETHEMFGIEFTGHPGLKPLLLPEEFEGHPLRKDFVLASRVAKAWPGAKEPRETGEAKPKRPGARRRLAPPGVPTPDEWGPRQPGLPETGTPEDPDSEAGSR